MELHPPTYEIKARHTDVNGESHIQSHWVWDSAKFMAARSAECADANRKHREETNQPGRAKVELL